MISIVQLLTERQLRSGALCNKLKSKFVVQEHGAVRAGLHYDIRLEKDCVLKSWSSRKLPQLVAGQVNKIMLFQTPDHSLDWFDFKGEITDVYGRGKVDVWDTGDYDLIKWDKTIIANFKGRKLKGTYAIVPMQKEGQFLMLKSKER